MVELSKTLKALRQNGMEAEYLDTREALLRRLGELLPPGGAVASGSSETLTALGVRQMLLDGGWTYYDAGDDRLSPAEREQAIRQAWNADVYLTSVAAVTQTGELLVVDGTGNRVSALAYGPRSVIVIASRRKITADAEAALARLKTVAAPQNALRRGKTALPCARSGVCMDCRHPLRMCCYFLKIGFSRTPGRIRVLITEEAAGF